MTRNAFIVLALLPMILTIGLFGNAVHAASSNSSSLIKPTLSIDIPTVTFSDGEIDGDTIKINYLGDYIAGVYKWLLGSATLIAIVMLMIGGLQYSIFQEDKAKIRIKNAVTGLVLLLSTYLILVTINPRLVVFTPLELTNIEEVGLAEDEDDSVDGGSLVTEFVSATASNVSGDGATQIPADFESAIASVAKVLEDQGYGMSISSSFRTVEQQEIQIRKKCKNPPGSDTCDPIAGVTACILKDLDPKNCPHTSGRALDIWGTKLGSTSQCITQAYCNKNLGDKDPCRLDECQAALITAMRDAGFCNLSSEAWHFENPKMSKRCN